MVMNANKAKLIKFYTKGKSISDNIVQIFYQPGNNVPNLTVHQNLNIATMNMQIFTVEHTSCWAFA
jgi:hypothetical protein